MSDEHVLTVRKAKLVLFDLNSRGKVQKNRSTTYVGKLTVTPVDITLRINKLWRTEQIKALRSNMTTALWTWRPILFGNPRLEFSDGQHRYSFRLRDWNDVQAAQELLATPIPAGW